MRAVFVIAPFLARPRKQFLALKNNSSFVVSTPQCISELKVAVGTEVCISGFNQRLFALNWFAPQDPGFGFTPEVWLKASHCGEASGRLVIRRAGRDYDIAR
jgi:hypothetical protein